MNVGKSFEQLVRERAEEAACKQHDVEGALIVEMDQRAISGDALEAVAVAQAVSRWWQMTVELTSIEKLTAQDAVREARSLAVRDIVDGPVDQAGSAFELAMSAATVEAARIFFRATSYTAIMTGRVS
ncbi:hypothetical protein [Actinocorallia longicatena]|uniref:Uncharacterized protein n=1 Tax=Actinocorallia longicatena TaxID=111803 RepID=A0ABP6QLZ7_9ACTN